MKSPLILITVWRRPLPTYLGERTLLDTVDPAYADHVERAGGRPMLISRPMRDFEHRIPELVEMADGFVFTGGGDVDPSLYGAPRENVEDDDIAADRFELALLRAAEQARVPTLAICRGAQLLALAHGGRLSQRPQATAEHPDRRELTPMEILESRHPVCLSQRSRVREAFGRDEITVNTIHHHQIAEAGDLITSAATLGGVIEGVEPRSDWSCVGVQWHPEKMADPEQHVLFEQLVRNASRAPAPVAA
jgi:putative glutamine amidotransferase